MSYSNAATAKSTVASVFAYVGGAFFGLMGSMAVLGWFLLLEDDPSDLSTLIISVGLIALGAFLIVMGVRVQQRVKRFRRYLGLIVTQKMTSVDRLAENTVKNYDQKDRLAVEARVKKDLQKMIEKGLFGVASIRFETNEILLGQRPIPPPIPPPMPGHPAAAHYDRIMTAAEGESIRPEGVKPAGPEEHFICPRCDALCVKSPTENRCWHCGAHAE